MSQTDELRRLLGEASLDWDESKSGPGALTAEATKVGGAILWHDDGDCAAVFHPHPLINPMALASLVAAVLPVLPRLLDVVEAARERQAAITRMMRSVEADPMDEVVAEGRLRSALAALEGK